MALTLAQAVQGSYSLTRSVISSFASYLSGTQETAGDLAQVNGDMDTKTEFHELKAIYKELVLGYLELQKKYDVDIKKEQEINATLQRQLKEERSSHATAVSEHKKEVKNLTCELHTLRQQVAQDKLLQEEACVTGTSLRMEVEELTAKLHTEFEEKKAVELEEMSAELERAKEEHEQRLIEFSSLLDSEISKNKALNNQIGSLNHQLHSKISLLEDLVRRDQFLSMELEDLKAHLHETSTRNTELVAKLNEMESHGNISENQQKISKLTNLLDLETEENRTLWDQIEYLTIQLDIERRSRKKLQQRLREDEV